MLSQTQSSTSTFPQSARPAAEPAWRRFVDACWAGRWTGTIVTTGVVMVAGLLVAAAMPRGPITSGQCLALMATGLAAGIIAGFMLRSRWAMLLAPAVNLLAFELGRLDTDGPMVDGIRLDTTFGILALFLGRGFYVLMGIVPMLLGVAYGVALARRFQRNGSVQGRGFGWYARRFGGGLTTTGLIFLAILISLPASVPAVRGADGEPVEGGIAELAKVQLGGHDQWIEIRAANPENPVLLWLAGGPGQSDLAITRTYFDNMAQDFVFVDWDQRGTGKSYPALDPTENLTLEQAVSDTIALTEYLCERFDEPKIYLAGVSWGTTLGVLAVQQRPDLYHAYIGTGQMVSQRETDLRIYRDMLAYAEATGDDGMRDKLTEFGEPPYEDAFAYGYVMQNYEKLEPEFDPPAAYEEKWKGLGISGERGSEYRFVEKVNVLRGLLDMFWTMYPQLQEIDFRHDVPSLDVPVYVIQGEGELAARNDLALEWFNALQAPSKWIVTLPDSGHSVAYEQFEEFHRILVDVVVPETMPGSTA